MFGGIKITLILCLTVVVSCVLFISYNEYTNRYSLVIAPDNSVYIFDKKSTVLNRCNENGCAVIETKLPTKTINSFEPNFQQSKMFEATQPMTSEVIEKIPSNVPSKIDDVEKISEDQSQKSASNEQPEQPRDQQPSEKSTEKESNSDPQPATDSTEQQTAEQKEDSADDEFVE